jgi:hypothetical protein
VIWKPSRADIGKNHTDPRDEFSGCQRHRDGDRFHDSAGGGSRVVRADEGKVTMAIELIPRFGYGKAIPWVTRSLRSS